jgi:hypothetical protein
MNTRRALLTAITAAVILGTPTVGYAARPSGSIGPSDFTDGWTGKRFDFGSVPSPGFCNQRTCDYFNLTVVTPGGYWDSHTGRAIISIRWASSSDNFDLYVYRGGKLLASSTQPLSTTEAVSLSRPGGGYRVRVVPVLVTDSGYSGSASFASERKPPLSGSVPSGPPPTKGQGRGGGSGGSGSGGGPVSVEPQERTIRSLFNGPRTAPPSSGPLGSATSARPVAFTVPRLSPFVWLLIPLGLVVLVGVAYTVFEPEPETDEEPLPEPEWRSFQPSLTPAPVALAGALLRAASGVGKAARTRLGRGRIGRPRSDFGQAGTGQMAASPPSKPERGD